MQFGGKRVLLAEDEPIIAMSVEDLLADLGCTVVGPAFSAEAAIRYASDEHLDAALLDINMGDSTSFPIASLLHARSVPFCFASGYGPSGAPAEFDDVPVLTKPYTREALVAALTELFATAE